MSIQFESPLLRSPYEVLERTTRNAQKLATKELTAVSASAKGLVASVKATPQAPAAPAAAKESALKALQSMVNSLQGLKRKIEENQKSSERVLSKFTARIEHLEALDDAQSAWAAVQRDQNVKRSKRTASTAAANGATAAAADSGGGGGGGVSIDDKVLNERSVAAEEQLIAVTKKRLDRIFVDHLLRAGFYNTAQNLVADAKLNDLVDLDIFLSARRVVESLNQFDVSRGLAWCGENRSKLGRIKNPLEFNLRIQEFVELLRVQKVADAVAYSQKHFGAHAEDHLTEIQHAMALIAFLPALSPLPTLNATDKKAVMEVEAVDTKSQSASAGPAAAAAPHVLLSRSSSTASADEPTTPTTLFRRSSSTTSTGSAAAGSGLARSDSKADAAGDATSEKKSGAVPDPLKSYRDYFERSRWVELVNQFRNAHYQLHGLTSRSLFDITMQSGLSALKTPYCEAHQPAAAAAATAGGNGSNCPVCCHHPPMAALASSLPVAQRVNSRIVCRLSGQIMDEHNPPLVLPNGHVYSKNALHAMAASNAGIVMCPRTRAQFAVDQCRVAYVL